MSSNDQHPQSRRPNLFVRLFSVWFRHVRVYSQNLISNGLPPFLEPLIFLVGLGLGLGSYITEMNGVPFVAFLGTGLLMTAAMFTAAFECSFGTFVRLEFDKVYDGMLAAPVTAENLLVGEMLWAGTKGLFFTFAVLVTISLFGIVPLGAAWPTPFVGFLTGTAFAALSLLITSFVKNLNHFNFYFSGFLSPMFFFAGVVFPVSDLPEVIRPISEAMPLTHSVRLVRGLSLHGLEMIHLWDLGYLVLFSVLVGWFAVARLKKRLID
ncbi:MAG: ABC transporter permease [Spirochaetales bacterium]|nr:ABC transporter permease [Spirochaetales bacterium]MCF7936961.1 ABC transporter permease [Spirochaetales bacterium]